MIYNIHSSLVSLVHIFRTHFSKNASGRLLLKLYTKIFKKKTDSQSFSHVISDHPKSLIASINYSLALQLKLIF